MDNSPGTNNKAGGKADACGYARLSNIEERSSSIPSQKKRIEEYCERYGLNLLKIFVDDGKSGWTFDRPGFIELEAFCKANKAVKYLIIPHFDRFSRADPIDAMVKERQFRDKLKVKVLQVSEPPDTDTENSTYQIIRFMQAFAANEERARIIDRTKTGMRFKMLQGRYCATAPFGYKNVRVKKSETDRGEATIVIDENRAPIIEFIFKQFLKGCSIADLYRMAIEKGFTVKGKCAIQSVLSNPVHAGLVNVPPYKNQPARIVKGLHPGIVSEADYWEVQQKLSPRKFIPQKRPEVPLRGVLRCQICSKLMTAAPSKSRNGNYYWYYFCTEHRKENYSAVKIHGNLDLILEAISIKGERLSELKTNLAARIQHLISTQTKELMNVNLSIRKVEKSIADIEEKYLLQTVAAETFNKVIGEKKIQLGDLLDKKEILSVGAYRYLDRLDEVMSKAASVRTVYNQLDIVSKQLFMKQIFGTAIFYTPSGFRTGYIHPVFAININKLNELPLIVNSGAVKKSPEFPSVTPEGCHTNHLSEIESLFAIFAA